MRYRPLTVRHKAPTKFQNQSTTEIADDISAERGKTARKTALLPIYSNCLSLVLNLLYFAASWIDLGED